MGPIYVLKSADEADARTWSANQTDLRTWSADEADPPVVGKVRNLRLHVDELVSLVVVDGGEVAAEQRALLTRLGEVDVLVVEEHVAAVLELEPVVVAIGRRRTLATRRRPRHVNRL